MNLTDLPSEDQALIVRSRRSRRKSAVVVLGQSLSRCSPLAGKRRTANHRPWRGKTSLPTCALVAIWTNDATSPFSIGHRHSPSEPTERSPSSPAHRRAYRSPAIGRRPRPVPLPRTNACRPNRSQSAALDDDRKAASGWRVVRRLQERSMIETRRPILSGGARARASSLDCAVLAFVWNGFPERMQSARRHPVQQQAV